MIDERRTRLRPVPFDTPVQRFRERADLGLLGALTVEVRLAQENSGEEERRVDRREFDGLEALASLHIEEVVEEPPVTDDAARRRPLRSRREESERRQHALPGVFAAHPAALDADRIRGQTE